MSHSTRVLLLCGLVIALALSIGPASAGPNAWSTNGPSVAGVLWRLALDPTRNATIYAAGASGSGTTWTPRVYRSIDVGATWQELTNGMVNIQINTLTVDPTNGTTIFVGGYNPAAKSLALYRSTNSGTNWTLVGWPYTGADLDRPVLSLAVDPTNHSNVYVGTAGAVLKSTNGGDSWTPLTGLPATAMRSVLVERTNGNNVYAAGDGGLYRSNNAGVSWAASNNGLPNAPGASTPRIGQIVADPTNAGVLYSVVSTGATDQVYRSTDAGTTWAAANNGMAADVIRELSVDPRSPSVLYAALNGGSGQNLMRSADAGASWAPFSLPGGGYSSSVVVDNVDPQTIHVAHNDAVWDTTGLPGGSPVATGSPTVTPVGGFATVTPAGGTATPVATGTPAAAAPHDNRFFPETSFRIDNDAFWDYFNRRGGTRIFGLPTSRTFQFLGFNSQFFQRAVMQQTPDGSVRLINLLDPGLLPLTSFNGALVPGSDAVGRQLPMRTKRQLPTIFTVLLAAVVAIATAHGSPPLLRATPEVVGMSSERLQAATAVLRQFVADRKVAGAVAAVARHGKLVYLEPVGLQSLEPKAPMTERSLFRVYSMTKAVTAVAVMMLVEDDKLRLTDPVSKYLPEFKQVMVQEGGSGTPRKPSREITIQDLLLHTSGLSHRTSELYRRLQVRSRSITLPQFVVNITKAPLLEDPGTRFRYSEATTVLGRVVEVIARESFDSFVATRILQPLGMSDTSFWVEGDARNRLATVYQRPQDGAMAPVEMEEVPFTEKPALMEGAVGLVSTAEDFVRFSQMLLDKGELNGVRLLKTETAASMTVNALPAAVLQGKGGNVGWGLGNVDVVVGAGSRGYLTSIGEYGWDGSAGTFFAVDPSRELVVVLMTQNLPANPDGLRQKFKAAILQAVVE